MHAKARLDILNAITRTQVHDAKLAAGPVQSAVHHVIVSRALVAHLYSHGITGTGEGSGNASGIVTRYTKN